jgi:hypothetical protein
MSSTEARKIAYRPRWAGEHVTGWFTPREVNQEGEVSDQMVGAACARCGAVYGPVVCTSGLVRDKIDKFALVHAHRNPMLR